MDARWLGRSGIGRLTELLLVGLRDLRPAGSWVVWGPRPAADFLWPGARHVLATRSPLAVAGQRDVLRVPPGQVLFLQLVRPLVVRRDTVVLAHDTIPLRWSPGWAQQAGHRLLDTVSAHLARRVLVYSATTASHVRRDLFLPARRLIRLECSVDLGVAERIRAARSVREPAERLLYVGLHKPHKNLERALRAFPRTEFARGGGTFHIVGPTPQQIDALRPLAARVPGVLLHGRCSDDELVEHYATAAAVIQPSLEEGFGLTVVEALSGHVPVCCSAGGALEEAAAGCAELFDPHSVPSMAAAIDRAMTASDWPERFERFASARPLPTPAQFAASIVAAMDEAAR